MKNSYQCRYTAAVLAAEVKIISRYNTLARSERICIRARGTALAKFPESRGHGASAVPRRAGSPLNLTGPNAEGNHS